MGAGDMSIGTGEATALTERRVFGEVDGELMDNVEAKDISRSDERKSSTSLCIPILTTGLRNVFEGRVKWIAFIAGECVFFLFKLGIVYRRVMSDKQPLIKGARARHQRRK